MTQKTATFKDLNAFSKTQLTRNANYFTVISDCERHIVCAKAVNN